MPKPFGCFEWISKLFFQKYIKLYNECWIPDYADEKNNLSGKLSHSKTNLKNIKFINPLSRFNENISTEKIESDILILISGPEPQRTLFEEIIISQLNKISIQQKKIIVVGGIFENRNSNFNLPEGVIYYASISPNEIKKYLVGAKKIICRSGYSTIMDLEALKLNAVFVPTPGQTEQEYLARWLQINSASTFVKQHQFDLKKYI
jgi:predicted glycosyltransferase